MPQPQIIDTYDSILINEDSVLDVEQLQAELRKTTEQQEKLAGSVNPLA